ncbi:DUF6146 family protein [Flavobacterium qiangtangense]|uniref:DUF6146 family protein n=1 Tax=Flavobacterium qiangtangense TaxID=1442595 RepID=A0ABW1PMV6_9FLAO
MKNLFYIVFLFAIIVGCSTSMTNKSFETEPTKITGDTIKIANEELEYEVIIIDPGFTSWFNAYARPRNYYSLAFLEARNRDWTLSWNNKFYQGSRLFDMPLNYENNIDYGYEVNYMIFNYLTYFQLTNNIKLGSFAPRF